ncbi:delta 9-fatty acid desaturase protein [Lentinula guzmanii]|uniref:Delta 9-fatty acid desaturase protein n=1 Tax=Lentinula guzmanii TaxID=2804957 RepID=A0AA38JR96_9AGAR|nr:delta 9-fatty acid desaturase protein [Lentinula guzmanii]
MSTYSEKFPAITGFRWFNIAVLVITPSIALAGVWLVAFRSKTMWFSILHYVFTMLGYHRLWSHRAYTASLPLQWFLIIGGTSAVQGSCYWWARAHRSHHRHTDTDLDPYDSNRGLLWTHIGWMIFKTNLRSGTADISDLKKDPLIQFQHRQYLLLTILFGIIVPWITNPRDHLLSALLTMGEGYHNFHHQFPMDYRNAYLWYQYDPTKWFIALCKIVGFARNLQRFPSNEIQKGALTMQLKALKKTQDSVKWPAPVEELPVVGWETFQEESKSRTLILVSGFIHDVSSFIEQHPGGPYLLSKNSGHDMTASFFGGFYAHSNAAHNLLAMMRVGILAGGVEMPAERAIPPSQQLYIAERA